MYKNFSLLSVVTVAIASTFASALPRTAQAQLPNSGNLTAEVSALRNKTGQVCFSLFDSGKGFPNDEESIVETKCVSADASAETPSVEADSTDEPATESASAESQVEAATAAVEAAAEAAVTTDAEAETDTADTEVGTTDTQEADTEAAHASISVTFESLPLGTYAVSVFHDENEDGEINQGNFGIPLEGFGFSKNPSITTRAPEFSETAVIVVGANTTTEIELIYY